MQRLNPVSFHRRNCPSILLSYRPSRSLPAIRSKSTLPTPPIVALSPDCPLSSLHPKPIVPFIHPTGRAVCPVCERIASVHLDQSFPGNNTTNGRIPCKCRASIGIDAVRDLPSWTAKVKLDSIPHDPEDNAGRFARDAHTLLSVGRAIQTLTKEKGHLDLSPSTTHLNAEWAKSDPNSSVGRQWYPYIDDVARALRWQTYGLLRPRFVSLRSNVKFKKDVPKMNATMQALRGVINSLRKLLPREIRLQGVAHWREVRASPPEIALELVAQTVHAETVHAETRPNLETPEGCKAFREFTIAPFEEHWLTTNLVGSLKKTVQDLGLEKRVLPRCSYVVFPSKVAQPKRELHWVTVRSTFMGWNHKGQQTLLKERRDGLAKSFAHLPAMQRAKQELINDSNEQDIPQGTSSPRRKGLPYLSPGIAFNNNINPRLPCQICGYFHDFHRSHEVGETKRMDEGLWKKERAIFSCAELGVAAIMHCVDDFDRRCEGS